MVNIYIFYEISSSNNNNSNYPTLKNYLVGAVSLTENADFDKPKCFGYRIRFDWHWSYSHPSGGNKRNAIMFGVDMSSSTKIDNRKNIFWFWV